MKPRFTFAIPFYRGTDYLREAIASVVAQRRPDWRCLVLDEQAEPGAADVVRSFGDARIEHHPNATRLGIVANWNRGLDLAETELVTLLHGDDRLLPDYADVIGALADAYPGDVALACDADIIGPDGNPAFSFADWVKRRFVPAGEPWRLEGESGLAAIARADFVMCPTVAWRLPVLGPRRFAAGWKQVQDLDLLATLLLDGEAIVGTRRHAYAYRRHAASATSQQTADLSRFDEEIAVLNRIAGEARKRGWHRAAGIATRKDVVRLHLGFRAASDLVHGRAGDALVKLRRLATT